MLAPAQRAEFERLGFTRLRGAFGERDAALMCDRIWAALAERHGIRRDDRTTWTVAIPRHLQSLPRSGAFDAIGSPVLTGAIDDLLGAGAWKVPRRWGQALVTFPARGLRWDVPDAIWHMDWPGRGPAEPLFGVKVLAYPATVLPGGGGTVIIAGSHRLVARRVEECAGENAGGSAKVRGFLMRQVPWFRALDSRAEKADRIERFMSRGTTVDGVELRVVELTGEPGDVILFHPWMFHAPAANCRDEPRLVISENLNTAAGLALYVPTDAPADAMG
jgi:hypothetical protein